MQQRKFSLNNKLFDVIKKSGALEMSESKLNEPAAAVDLSAGGRTLKDVVLEGLEEKGSGRDLWLW